jgi:integrase
LSAIGSAAANSTANRVGFSFKEYPLIYYSEYIFATREGTPVEGNALIHLMKLHSQHSVHDLRHTYCTRAARAGINPKVLQTITGHKKIETLLSIYTHVTENDKMEAVERIARYCSAATSINHS